MKYKILLLLALTVIFASKCTKEDPPIVYFDHVTQAQKDNDSLVKFFQTNYLDSNGEIKKIDAGQTPIWGNSILKDTIIKYKWDYKDDAHDVVVNYKLYYIVLNEGIGVRPTVVDSTFISYKGRLLNGTVFDENPYGLWFNIFDQYHSPIRGIYNGWVHFKSGNLIVNADQSFSFENQGTGILIMPSGLGYADESKTKIPSNSPLIFYVSLNMVKRTDWDLDGIYSIYEDLNHNGDYTDDDTDGDGYPNYRDADDDGDGTLTKNEHPDPNGDHNPADAEDANNNGIPDYLDPLTK